ncbi:hypothetical protein H1C71_001274 [Ictidomys tridecemlineatus]|nr:hypothetical protein H1C71_001274 [Ictidomys tridecemlineatus]
MEQVQPADGRHFYQTQETLENFMEEAPDDAMLSLTVSGCQWEIMECVEIVQVLIVILLLCKIVQTFRERLSLQGDKEPSSSSSAVALGKCNVLDQFHPSLEENENSEVADDSNFFRPVRRSIICIVVRHRRKEKCRCSKQEKMSLTAKRIQALDQERTDIKKQEHEMKSYLKCLPATDKRPRLSIVSFMFCMKIEAMYLQEEWFKITEGKGLLGRKDLGENLESGEPENETYAANKARVSRKKLKVVAKLSTYLNIHDSGKALFYNSIVKEMKKACLRGHNQSAQIKELFMKGADSCLEEGKNEMVEQYHQKEMEYLGLFPVNINLDLQQEVENSEANDLTSHENKETEMH